MESESVAKRLKGRIALITGASRGIGRAIAIRFAQEGADLFLCATRMETLKETQALASKYDQRIELYTVDVAEREAVKEMVERSIELFGQIDILVITPASINPPHLLITLLRISIAL